MPTGTGVVISTQITAKNTFLHFAKQPMVLKDIKVSPEVTDDETKHQTICGVLSSACCFQILPLNRHIKELATNGRSLEPAGHHASFSSAESFTVNLESTD